MPWCVHLRSRSMKLQGLLDVWYVLDPSLIFLQILLVIISSFYLMLFFILQILLQVDLCLFLCLGRFATSSHILCKILVRLGYYSLWEVGCPFFKFNYNFWVFIIKLWYGKFIVILYSWKWICFVNILSVSIIS